MSLLMDALKKAEQEKEKAKEAGSEDDSSALAADQTGDNEQPGVESTDEYKVPDLDATVHNEEPQDMSGTLSLEPIGFTDHGDSTGELATPEDPAEHVPHEEVDLDVDQLSVTRVDDEREITGERDIALEKASAMHDMESSAEEPDLDSTFYSTDLVDQERAGGFEDTMQGETMESIIGENTYDETLPGVSAVDLINDMGDTNQPTPVAAQTVFEASKTTRSSSTLKWTMSILAFTILGVIAVGVLVYQSQSITPRQLPSPEIARGIEATPPPINTEIAQVVEQTVSGTLIDTTTGAGVDTPEISTQNPDQSLTEEAYVSGLESSDAFDTEVAIADEANTSIASTSDAVDAGFESNASNTTSTPLASLPPEIEVTNSLLQITRSQQLDTAGVEVNEAYQAYQNGDYQAAKSGYETLIQKYPDSRDGLLGLAAISLFEGERNKAFMLYSQVLRLDPKNTVANSALMSMTGSANDQNQESSLKLMLRDNPDSPFLYFSLGNYYAAQSRWADAQQAFFNAYRHDSTNPNYALNLAVSLDHLSQRQAALDYYNTALELADLKQSQFDSASILTRISTLNNN